MWLATTLTFDPGVDTGRWQSLSMGATEVSEGSDGSCVDIAVDIGRVHTLFMGASEGSTGYDMTLFGEQRALEQRSSLGLPRVQRDKT